MWSKRTLGASGYTEAQEDSVEPAHSNYADCTCANRTCANRTCANRTCSNCTCSNCTCANRTRSNCTSANYAGDDRTCSSRVRIAGTGRRARFWRSEEQPIGRGD
jgi:hypothetical protein